MGARPDQFRKGGGGFLNGVDGNITGYRFTDEFNGVAFEAGKKPGTKEDKFHSLFMELHARVDGADEDVTQNLFVGNADLFKISDDGLTIWDAEYETAEEADAAKDTLQLGQGTPVTKFIVSLVEAGFPVANLSDSQSTNLEAIIGSRVRFGQQDVLDKDGKVKMREAKKGKFKGKKFPDTTTVVTKFYELPKAAGKKAAAKAEPKATKGAKATKAAEPEGDDAVTELATTTLVAILKKKGGTIAKSKVSMAVLDEIMKHKLREPVRKLVNTDAFLERCDGWKYDSDVKSQPITLLDD